MPFVFVVKTDNSGTSTSTQFTMPLVSGGNYDFTVTRVSGPGTLTGDPVAHSTTTPLTLDFSTAGTYELSVAADLGDFIGWNFANGGDRLKLLEIKEFGPFQLHSSFDLPAFRGCTNLSFTASDGQNFLAVATSVSDTFRDMGTLNNERFPHFANLDFSGIPRYNSCFRAPGSADGTSAFDWDISQMDFSSISLLDRFSSMFQARRIATPRYNAFLKSIANQIQAETMIRGIGTTTACHFGNSLYDLGAPKKAFDYITSPIVDEEFTVNTSTNIITCTAHGLSDGHCITLKTTDTLPAGLNTTDRYYVISSDTDTFALSMTQDGGAVNITDTGTGTHTVFGGGGMVIESISNQNTGEFEATTYILANTTPLTDAASNVVSGAVVAMIDKTRLEELHGPITPGEGIEVIENDVILALAKTDSNGFISVDVSEFTNFDPTHKYYLSYYYVSGGVFYPGAAVRLIVTAT
jgi:hypothetical protein